MAFKGMDFMDIYEIFRRWHAGQKINHIARNCNLDRKTVRKYILLANQIGLSREASLPCKEDLLPQLAPLLEKQNQKPVPAQTILLPYLQEISDLVNNADNALKPKIAFEVICQRHGLEGRISYSSFKRFSKQHVIALNTIKTTCRMEVDPGLEIQIDYGYMGFLFDPLAKRRRKVYAFIATLSHSRHMFVQFVYKQDQQSFVASHVDMFKYFGGVTAKLVIDNLKAGVIKPDLYLPTINRTYQEMAEHYNTFIDPCRVGQPQEKGKVENQVPVVRQQFRKQLALNAQIDIGAANMLVQEWCMGKHGLRIHGTTQWQPLPTFLSIEKPTLKPLSEEPFEISHWKQATVHSDHYIQFEKKAYSVPHAYVTKKVMVKGTAKLVQIYYENRMIKQHVRLNNCYRHTDYNDFPENVQAALGEGLPKYLLEKAARTSPYFGQLIRAVLEPHAFINLRKAQALVAEADHFPSDVVEQAAQMFLTQRRNLNSKTFKLVLRKLQNEKRNHIAIPISDPTRRFVRPMDYFINNNYHGDRYERKSTAQNPIEIAQIVGDIG
jgi:hypothetical protein